MKGRVLMIVAALACCGGVAHGQVNGITFGPVKEYDERTLLARFSRLQSAFLQVGSFLDKDSVKSAIGKLQGANASASLAQLGLNLQFPVTTFTNAASTSSSDTEKGTSKDTTKDGKTTNETTVDKTVDTSGTSTTSKTHKQSEPTSPELKAPGVSTGLSLPTLAPQISASDVLAEQTQLSFQLINLSMLLDRSVTERATSLKNTLGLLALSTPRTLVIGLDVSIVPKHKDAVAQVVIEAANLGKCRSPLLVTSLMPYEKTYNTATFTNKTTGFSMGTVFQFVGLSTGQQSNSSNLYFARDLDTIGLQFNTPRQPGDDPVTSFGWQFRPSLNRRTVEAGTRQLFAVLSIPTGITPEEIGEIRFEAKTQWYAYDRGKNLVKGRIGMVESTPLGSINVLTAQAIADALRPKVVGPSVTLFDAGNGNVLVTAKGENFFPGTSVSIGQVLQSPADEFSVPGESTVRFVTSLSDLLTKSPEIVGPYGVSKPLFEDTPRSPILFGDMTSMAEPVDAETVRLSVRFKPTVRGGSPDDAKFFGTPGMLRAEFPIGGTSSIVQVPLTLVAGGYAYGLSDRPVQVLKGSDGYINLTVFAPLASLRGQSEVKLIHLIHNSQAVVACPFRLPSDLIVDGLSVEQSGSSAVFTLRGGPFHADDVQLMVGGMTMRPKSVWPEAETATVVTFVGGAGLLEGLESVMLLRDGRSPLRVDLKAPSIKTTVTSITPPKVKEAVALTVEGTGLDKVKEVKIGSEAVEWFLDAADKHYKLILKPEHVEVAEKKFTVTFTVDGGASIRYVLEVQA